MKFTIYGIQHVPDNLQCIKKRKCCIHNATQYICSLYRTCHISSAHCTITHNMMFIHKTQVYVHTYIHTYILKIKRHH